VREQDPRRIGGDMEVIELEPTKSLERGRASNSRRKPDRTAVVFEMHCPSIEPQKTSDVRSNNSNERGLEECGENPDRNNNDKSAEEQLCFEIKPHAFRKYGSPIVGSYQQYY
jgi:hypothetical protein